MMSLKNNIIRSAGRLGIVAAVVLTAGLMPAAGELAAKEVEITGMLRSYTAGRTSESDVPVSEQTVDLKLEGWGDMSHIVVNPSAYVDPEDSGAGTPEIGVREAYLDLYFSAMDLRIGQQAVVWGQAEGAFITDIVSPQNLRSFILSDFTEVRMGVPAVRADYYAGPLTFEAVWLPRFVPTEQPEAGSMWYTDQMALTNNAQLPDDGLENSELFGKVSYFGAMFNAELMAGYAWDDLPVLKGSALSPEAFYERYTVLGGSFSTTIGSVVLRSEAAAYLNRAFTTVTSPGPPLQFAAGEYHQLHGLAGLDWSLLGVDMSAQYILQYIHDYEEVLQADEFDHTVTFRMRDSYLSDTLTAELFAYVGVDHDDPAGKSDALLRPSLTYSIEEGVEVQTGVELFLGDEAGKFGRYEDNTMAYVSLRWYF